MTSDHITLDANAHEIFPSLGRCQALIVQCLRSAGEHTNCEIATALRYGNATNWRVGGAGTCHCCRHPAPQDHRKSGARMESEASDVAACERREKGRSKH